MKEHSKNIKQKIILDKLSYDEESQHMVVYKDLPIIARITNKTYDICNNETFTVTSVTDTTTIITDGTIFKTIQTKDFSHLFYPAYAITCHKAQGTTIDKPYTILEWRKFSTEMKYVAITRSTKNEYLNILA